jgi:hypothetical protein
LPAETSISSHRVYERGLPEPGAKYKASIDAHISAALANTDLGSSTLALAEAAVQAIGGAGAGAGNSAAEIASRARAETAAKAALPKIEVGPTDDAYFQALNTYASTISGTSSSAYSYSYSYMIAAGGAGSRETFYTIAALTLEAADLVTDAMGKLTEADFAADEDEE